MASRLPWHNNKNKTVHSLALKYNIPVRKSGNINSPSFIKRISSREIAIMLNFIQIITGEIIKCFTRGIINIHASRLPPDRGTSPVMCSFARNEKEIFATIYQADQGVDTGSIYHQWPIPVVKEDTLFSINCRVCSECGNKLVEILPSIYNLKLSKQVQDSSTVSNYNSWPDQSHARLMLANKKAFISFSQVYRLLIGNSTDLLQN